MTRISSYIIDQNIVGNDKWIGSDAQNNLRTKNFTPNNLADYFNGNNVIDIGTSIRYRYQTLDVGEEREQGTISFETEIGPQVNFSDITTFLIAKNTLKGNTVTEYLDFLVDSSVMLSKSSNINTFGYYKITSIDPWIVDPNFFVVVVEFLEGNGFIYEDLDYLVSLVDKSSGSGGAVWGSITGDILDQEDLIDYLNDGFYPLLTNPAGYLTLATLPPIPTLTSELINDVPFLVQEEVEEYADLANFPLTGTVGVIYVALDTGLFYTWNGTTYILSATPTSFTTLQQAYNASSTGEIITANLKPLVLKASVIGAPSLLQIKDFGGTIRANWYGNGDLQAPNINASLFYGGDGFQVGTPTLVTFFRFFGSTGVSNNRIESSNRIDYLADYSAYYTNRSLIDKGYADLTYLTSASLTGYVPYTGATQNVNLGEFELKAGQLSLDVSPTGTAAVATTRWNNNIGSSETTLKGGSVVLKNGVDLVARVVNKVTPNATLTKANYTAVRISGAQGQRLAVAYAQANNDNNSADTIGLVCETIATNQEGFILTVGQLEDINTTGSLQGETWSDGDVLYLSPTTPGSLTNIKPIAPIHIVVIGYVEYAHVNHGKIYVKIMNGWELDELHNVKINTPLNNQALVYNSSLQLWENKTIIEDSITNSVIDKAPSQNSVFDALETKVTFWGSGSDGTSVANTLTIEPTYSQLIPANTFGVGDIIDLECRLTSPGAKTSISNLYFYVNTSNSISGATQLAIYASGATNRTIQAQRKLSVKGATTKGINPTSSTINTDLGATAAMTTHTIDWTVDQYILFAIGHTVANQTMFGDFYKIQKT